MDGAHSSVLSDWLPPPPSSSFSLPLLDAVRPSSLSSIAILLPFLINLLFTTSTPLPCLGPEEPRRGQGVEGCCALFYSLPLRPYMSLIQYSGDKASPAVSELANDNFPPNPILLTRCRSAAAHTCARRSLKNVHWLMLLSLSCTRRTPDGFPLEIGAKLERYF